MKAVYLQGIGIAAPGLFGWPAARRVLLGETAWQDEALAKLVPQLLPPNERRRTTALIKLALQVAEEAVTMAGTEAAQANTVFASSDGDFYIVDRLCDALLQEGKPVSPTLFHNSVHNAPAGYWAIATASQNPSTSISAADATFSAGLLESVSQLATNGSNVLLVAYDHPAPFPLDEKRHFVAPFGVALLLAARADDSTLAEMELHLPVENDQILSRCSDGSMEALRQGNPAAASLPLLEAVARRQNCSIGLPYVAGNLLEVKIRA